MFQTTNQIIIQPSINGHSIYRFSQLETSIYKGFSMAMFVITRWYIPTIIHLLILTSYLHGPSQQQR
jgi:hypothetical protein